MILRNDLKRECDIFLTKKDIRVAVAQYATVLKGHIAF